MTTPLRFMGVEFDDRTDFATFAARALGGDSGLGAYPDDLLPLAALHRLYEVELAGTAYAARLAEGIAACLTAADPFVRYQATLFFQKNPMAPGAERLLDAVKHHRHLFSGIYPEGGDADLEWNLLRAVGARAFAGDAAALAQARLEALHGKAHSLIAFLTAMGPDWVVKHLDQIVRNTPQAIEAILRQIQRTGRDVGEVGERMARLGVVPPEELRELVTRQVDDPAARARILAALPS